MFELAEGMRRDLQYLRVMVSAPLPQRSFSVDPVAETRPSQSQSRLDSTAGFEPTAEWVQ